MSDTVRRIRSTDPRLGRHVEHDERSRRFALAPAINQATWHDKRIRIYDPRLRPNQTIGNCTGCAKAMQFDAIGNRFTGKIFGMPVADAIYAKATELDAWDGTYPPDDTGSSGLAAAKAAQVLGYGGTYRFLFGGADEVVQAVMDGHTINVGTAWHNNMFTQDSDHRIHLGGGIAGGHEWLIHGYDVRRDSLLGRCWWGPGFPSFWITRDDLAELLADDGDAHVQDRMRP